eukprot:364175-Chlamydomonas_euryale.AAC.11
MRQGGLSLNQRPADAMTLNAYRNPTQRCPDNAGSTKPHSARPFPPATAFSPPVSSSHPHKKAGCPGTVWAVPGAKRVHHHVQSGGPAGWR